MDEKDKRIKDLEQRIEGLRMVVDLLAAQHPDKEKTQMYLYLHSALDAGLFDQKPGLKGVLNTFCASLQQSLGAVPGQESASDD